MGQANLDRRNHHRQGRGVCSTKKATRKIPPTIPPCTTWAGGIACTSTTSLILRTPLVIIVVCQRQNLLEVASQCGWALDSGSRRSFGWALDSGPSSSVSPVPANNLFETPFGFVPDGGGQCKGLHPQVLVLMPAQLNSTGPTSTSKNESDHRPDYIPRAQLFFSAVDQAVNALPETGDLIASPSEKQLDSNAAAGARKRRKELKKLKSQNSRQFG
ncbi:hypothetical protein Acr_08g0018120 [Actinidia rufa]|uniref:Uncharacterized protein n=1 Tax=Actinidia rufa TaxID=165716 RepID=A0A7J0F4T9_9ERIC|nr:hypothetical protein Acr_08g0018120 [Actinidia rufa]